MLQVKKNSFAKNHKTFAKIMFASLLIFALSFGAWLNFRGSPNNLAKALDNEPATVATISPNLSEIAGGETVTIHGSRFMKTIDSIHFSGDAYFDSDVPVNAVDGLYVKFRPTDETWWASGGQALIGAGDFGADGLDGLRIYERNDGVFTLGLQRNNSIMVTPGLSAGTVYEAEILSDGSAMLDGIKLKVLGKTPTLPLSIYIGANDYYGPSNFASGVDIFEVKFYKDNSTINDWRPIIWTDDDALVYGLRDDLSGEILTKLGDGELTSSPAQNPLSVTIGGAKCAHVTVISDTELTCVVPAHAAGVVDVELNVYGEEATLPQSFTYVENCEWDNTLAADDAKCVKPSETTDTNDAKNPPVAKPTDKNSVGAPNTGIY